MIVTLWQDFPIFGEIFLSILFAKCPLLVPCQHELPPNPYTSDDETSNIHLQRQDQKTMAFLMAAIWISNGRQGRNLPHPFGIEHGWKYLVNVMKLKPYEKYVHILLKIFEIAGSTLHTVYGKQFVKLVKFILTKYLPNIEPVFAKSDCNQLKLMLEDFLKNMSFPSPKGELSPNYW